MKALLDKGADPNARVNKKVWYTSHNFDLSGIEETGSTAFWRAAYAADVDAMKLLMSYGADPHIPTVKPPERGEFGDAGRRVIVDVSGVPPVPVAGPGVPALLASTGVGYGEGFAGNSHRFAPGGMLAGVKFLIEVAGADPNGRDHEGNNAIHHAASRGDLEMMKYLVSKGTDPLAVNREGQTTIDMANGPVQRVQPWPEVIAYLEEPGREEQPQVPVLLIGWPARCTAEPSQPHDLGPVGVDVTFDATGPCNFCDVGPSNSCPTLGSGSAEPACKVGTGCCEGTSFAEWRHEHALKHVPPGPRLRCVPPAPRSSGPSASSSAPPDGARPRRVTSRPPRSCVRPLPAPYRAVPAGLIAATTRFANSASLPACQRHTTTRSWSGRTTIVLLPAPLAP